MLDPVGPPCKILQFLDLSSVRPPCLKFASCQMRLNRGVLTLHPPTRRHACHSQSQHCGCSTFCHELCNPTAPTGRKLEHVRIANLQRLIIRYTTAAHVYVVGTWPCKKSKTVQSCPKLWHERLLQMSGPVSYLIWGGHFQQSFYSITFWVNLWVRIKKLLESRAAFTAFTQIHIHKYPLLSTLTIVLS